MSVRAPRVVRALLALTLGGCSGMVGLPQDAVRARTALRQAIQTGDASQVSAAARAADRWKGRDPELDRLLGHALANVLMRPEEGLPLLEANPSDADAEWVGWLAAAALRSGDVSTMDRIQRGLSLMTVDPVDPVVEQYVVRARMDPKLGWDDMAEAVRLCALLDGQPRRGRVPLDREAPTALPPTALALGADRVVMGRPERLDDHDPLSGTGDVQCRTGRLVRSNRLPRPLPRNLTVGAEQGDDRLYISIKPGESGALAYGASELLAAERWLDAAETLDHIPDGLGWPGVDQVPLLHKRFGAGLMPAE